MKRAAHEARRVMALGRDQAWAVPLVVAMLLAAAGVVVLVASDNGSKVDGTVSSTSRSIELVAPGASSPLTTAVAAIAAATAAIPSAQSSAGRPGSTGASPRTRSSAGGGRTGTSRPAHRVAPTGTGTAPTDDGSGGAGKGSNDAGTGADGGAVAPVAVPDPAQPVVGAGGGNGGAAIVPTPAAPIVSTPAGGGVDVALPIGDGGVGVSLKPSGINAHVNVSPTNSIVAVDLGSSGLHVGILGLNISLGTPPSQQAGTS